MLHNYAGHMTTEVDRLANFLGAVTVALHDRLVGSDGIAALPPPAEHPSAAATLALLNWVPKMPQARLAYCVALSQPATVRLVDRLEDAGLVRRIRSLRRRQIWLESTSLGRTVASRLGFRRHEGMKLALASLSRSEQATLGGLLEKLAFQLLESKEHVMRVCRLCDARACGADDDCPMWRAALAVV